MQTPMQQVQQGYTQGYPMPPPGYPPMSQTTGLEGSVNNFLSGNMMGGSNDKKQYKLNFF
jgi:hypothetical protein